ncbi:SOS response-associated peptidase [Microbacterium sp. LRZ72]|uniref:SOS response-associated peptidase n=1 Tax=Microbacterium sp. LRZ72 TaxID=2942481 RepID=UPI0029B84C3D|nr:SOS response-associated peptidase [Microbacterium sp. LRZ72]MDX2375478.1 SOS response-associated peptidase [Microbacterium sp. LRZ72]
MCGRFVVARPAADLVGFLDVDTVADDLPEPSFNVAPTDRVAIVLDSVKTEPPTRRIESARWGLIPGWSKDVSIGARAINARAEDVETKPMFRAALERRRAIVPATGYYEWRVSDDGKVPHYIHPADGTAVFFAGLYEWWRRPDAADDDPARWLLSCTILTCAASGRLGSIHDRMPLFVDGAHAEAWLDPETENVGDVLDAAIDAAPLVAGTLDEHVVDRAVGNVRSQGPHLIEPAA